MSTEGRAVLERLLERLMAGLMNGPGLNCRPHNSRQRLDLISLAKLQDLPVERVLPHLLGEGRKVKFVGRVKAPVKAAAAEEDGGTATGTSTGGGEDEEQRPETRAWVEQQAVFTKLRNIAEDGKTYEQDTGVHVLSVGFPLLRVPPQAMGGLKAGGSSRRILAPIAFIPVSVTIKRGVTQSIELACRGSGVDLVEPNAALLAWLDQHQRHADLPEVFSDPGGEDPWREIAELVRRVCAVLGIDAPELFASNPPGVTDVPLRPAPRADEGEQAEVLTSAVLGLFPMANQGLIEDMKSLAGGEPLRGPVESFVRAHVSLSGDQPGDAVPAPGTGSPAGASRRRLRGFEEERLVAQADPSQAKAVRLARECRGLVVHGPPGTGKSQTITNVIGDHLARGQRVLFVCDKRTALDVVFNRLQHLGLGDLCAVVHDPQRDQRELYRAVRNQLEELVEAKTDATAEDQLRRADTELARLHAELTQYHASLMDQADGERHSLHELMGEWLTAPQAPVRLEGDLQQQVTYDQFRAIATPLRDLLDRARSADYPNNPWRECVGVSLQGFLARPMTDVREALGELVAVSTAADETAAPSIPPFASSVPLGEQAAARTDLADRLERVLRDVPADVRTHWAGQPAAAVKRASQRLQESRPMLERARSQPLDLELRSAVGAAVPVIAAIGQNITALTDYLEIASRWYAFAYGKRRKGAKAVLAAYGLQLNPENAGRVKAFLESLRDRMTLSQVYREVASTQTLPLVPDDELDQGMASHAAAVELLSHVLAAPSLAGLEPLVRDALRDNAMASMLADGLRRSAPRADAVTRVLGLLDRLALLGADWLRTFRDALLGGGPAGATAAALAGSVDQLENVVRVREGLAQLPPAVRAAAETLSGASVEPEVAVAAVRKAVLAGEITRRLAAHPHLQQLDARHLDTAFNQYRGLAQRKMALVREAIRHRWTALQKQRLLALTGTRLNSLGAEVKRRFTLQGERAMRLRRVVEVGRVTEGGDPFFDLRPVWMASPETVAQLFPREPIFDVVIFDEASQCKYEEALPVLTRAHRVVIAGDQQQLPPSRFFESAVVASEEREAETDQELFEAQQADTEDLLRAALKLEVQEAYLDVHYRSRSADLIEFSNEHFYNKRLQAIPGHPSNLIRFAPLSLERVGGTYEKGVNPAEAERVCQIVRDLLRRAEAPSIGVACFNVDQRDLILDKLDDLAAADPDFARRLSEARSKVGKGSFEGLFVKNLENVQGDERDHMIISTTYGPDAKGRFYRRFGPLGRTGGGRRLNVLVTRARHEVHLVTSIPAEAYRALPPVPPGQQPNGAWLLFAYLQYAEQLAEQYELAHRILTEAGAEEQATSSVRPGARPASRFAEGFGAMLARQHNIGSDVHWGNDGFAVDVALRHPRRAEDVTVGVLCDWTRFEQAEDPVQWDAFRTSVHESQGWVLHRLWTPHFFRDPELSVRHVRSAVDQFLAAEPPKDDLRTIPPVG